MPRIYLVDDHQIVREGVRRLFNTMRPEWEVCGEAGNGLDAIAGAVELNPDVMIIDVSMPGMSGFDVTRRVRELGVGAHILLFTMDESQTLQDEARKAGAQGCVRKSQAGCDLILAIDGLLAGNSDYFPEPESVAPVAQPRVRTIR